MFLGLRGVYLRDKKKIMGWTSDEKHSSIINAKKKTEPSCQCDSDFSRFPIRYILDIFGPITKYFFGFSCTLRSPGPEPVGLPGVLRWSREPDTMRARMWDEGRPVRHLGS